MAGNLAFYQSNVAGTRTLGRVLGLKLHPLTLAQQLEHCSAHRAAVKEMLEAPFIADETKSLIDEEACDSPGRHCRVLRRA